MSFHYKNGELFAEKVPVERIIKKTGTPVYIYSKEKIITNLQEYDAAFSGIPHILCYAVKANSNPAVLKEIFLQGAGADVTSGGELYRSIRAGVSPSKIVFAGIGKSPEEIEYAVRCGILMFNAESIEEAEVINDTGRRLRKRLDISFRINPDVNPHTHDYITTGAGDNKFGIPITGAVGAYLRAKRFSNINIAGMHCHIGSQITAVAPFKIMAQRLARIAGYLARKGINLRYIDIGGGLGVRYNNEKPPSPRDLARTVLPVIMPHCKAVVVEPGRYIVAESGILVTKVLYRKTASAKNFIVVDAGMTDLIRPALYGAYHEIVPVRKGGQPARLPSDIVGPVCESGDFLGKKRNMALPPRGSYLAVKNAGAYGFSMSSQYNSRPRAAEVLVNGSKWKIVRRRETYKDLDI